MGRSRGGLTTKILALVDAEGRPVGLVLTAGQAGDAPACEQLLPLVAKGAILIADRAYDPNAIRATVTERGAFANIPPRVIRKGSFPFSSWLYRHRNLVERFFNRIKHFRGLATRYDRSPDNFLAALKLAAIRIWLASKWVRILDEWVQRSPFRLAGSTCVRQHLRPGAAPLVRTARSNRVVHVHDEALDTA